MRNTQIARATNVAAWHVLSAIGEAPLARYQNGHQQRVPGTEQVKCDHCGYECAEPELYPADYVDPQLDRPSGIDRFIAPAGECPLCGNLAYRIEDLA